MLLLINQPVHTNSDRSEGFLRLSFNSNCEATDPPEVHSPALRVHKMEFHAALPGGERIHLNGSEAEIFEAFSPHPSSKRKLELLLNEVK